MNLLFEMCPFPAHCSDYHKERLLAKLQQVFDDIEFYSDTNFFVNLSNVEAEGAFLHAKNIYSDVLRDLE